MNTIYTCIRRISKSNHFLLDNDENIDCQLDMSYINMRYYWNTNQGNSEDDGVVWVSEHLNRACQQHSHNTIFHWNFQKYSVWEF